MNMKFRIQTPEQSKLLQEILFKLGYEWPHGPTVSYTDYNYIYAYDSIDVSLCYGETEDHFNLHNNKEIDISWMLPERETVEVLGNTYYKSDIEHALSGVLPLKEISNGC